MRGCDTIFYAELLINPCFDIYQIAKTCPLLWDVRGFPGSLDYNPAGATVYFNDTDVQKAINAPIEQLMKCTENKVLAVNESDSSPPSALPFYMV